VQVAPLDRIGAGKPGTVEQPGERVLADVTELTQGGQFPMMLQEPSTGLAVWKTLSIFPTAFKLNSWHPTESHGPIKSGLHSYAQ
jgi:hypothetical protein